MSPADRIDWSAARRFLEAAFTRLSYRRDGQLVQDLVQEAMVGLHRFVAKGGRVQNVEALMTTIAKRTFVDHLRRERVRKALFEDTSNALPEVADAGARPGDDEDPQAMIEFVTLEFFASTSAPCLELAHHYFALRNWKQVADATGRERDAVAKQWSRCVEALRRAAREEGSALGTLGPGAMES